MKKLIIAFISFVIGHSNIFAWDFSVDGLRYTILSHRDSTCAISSFASYDCNSIDSNGSLELPNKVLYEGHGEYKIIRINSNVFDNVNQLQEIIIPEGIVTIQSHAFKNCINLSSVSIPKSCTDIGMPFYGCTSLPVEGGIRYADCIAIETTDKTKQNYVVKGGTRFIAVRAFEDCASATTISLPNELEVVCGAAFVGCSSLQFITIPQNVRQVSYNSFDGCTSLITSSENVNYVDCVALGPTTSASSYTIKDGTRIIAEKAFYSSSGNQTLYYIDIPNSIEHICNSAFYGCNSLAEINFNEGLKTIGNYAFYQTTNLTSKISFPSTLEYIGSYAFANSGLTYAYGMSRAVNLRYIGEKAFQYARKLEDFTVSDCVVILGDNAFEGCTSLQTVHLGNSLKKISASTFEGCTKLSKLTIGNSVQTIDYRALYGCTSLRTISLPASVRTINEQVFECQNLHSAEFASIEQVCSMNYAGTMSSPFQYAKHLYIDGAEVFDVVIPKSVSRICPIAFRGCNYIRSITIPETVTSIGKWAIYYGNALTTVRTTCTTPPALEDEKESISVSTSVNLVVPDNCKTLYSNTKGWKTFTNITENDTPIDIQLSSSKWGTMILPYNAIIPNNLMVYSCNSSEGDILALEEQTSIVANTPYLVYGEPGLYHFDGVGYIEHSSDTDGWLTGAYIETDVPENSYILAKVNDIVGFYKVTGTNVGKAKIAPYHCYLTSETPTGQAMARFLLSDDATGISAITNADSSKAVITDLAGRRLSSLAKGINIINGVKVMIK